MSDESMEIITNSREQLRVKKKQLSTLQAKEVEENEKVSKLNKLLEQATLDHETCMRSNLAGNANDQDLKKSKAKIKELTDSIQESKDALKFISETRPKLNSEISSLAGDATVHRAVVCSKLAEEAYGEMASNGKLNEKLAAGYAAFRSSGHYNLSWLQYLLLCFPHPSDHDMNLATEKFKASNDFMRD